LEGLKYFPRSEPALNALAIKKIFEVVFGEGTVAEGVLGSANKGKPKVLGGGGGEVTTVSRRAKSGKHSGRIALGRSIHCKNPGFVSVNWGKE